MKKHQCITYACQIDKAKDTRKIYLYFLQIHFVLRRPVFAVLQPYTRPKNTKESIQDNFKLIKGASTTLALSRLNLVIKARNVVPLH